MSKNKSGFFSGLRDKLDDELDIPKTSLTGGSHIELLDNHEAVIEGCKCVAEYNDRFIKLNMGGRCIRFTGQNLIIRNLRPEQLNICGEILTIDFCD